MYIEFSFASTCMCGSEKNRFEHSTFRKVYSVHLQETKFCLFAQGYVACLGDEVKTDILPTDEWLGRRGATQTGGWRLGVGGLLCLPRV